MIPRNHLVTVQFSIWSKQYSQSLGSAWFKYYYGEEIQHHDIRSNGLHGEASGARGGEDAGRGSAWRAFFMGSCGKVHVQVGCNLERSCQWVWYYYHCRKNFVGRFTMHDIMTPFPFSRKRLQGCGQNRCWSFGLWVASGDGSAVGCGSELRGSLSSVRGRGCGASLCHGRNSSFGLVRGVAVSGEDAAQV